jgi:hypothetical protein
MAYLALVRHVVRVGREPRAPGKGKAAQPTQGKTLAPAAHHALGDLVSGVVDLVGAPEGDGGEKGRGGGERWEWVMQKKGARLVIPGVQASADCCARRVAEERIVLCVAARSKNVEDPALRLTVRHGRREVLF